MKFCGAALCLWLCVTVCAADSAPPNQHHPWTPCFSCPHRTTTTARTTPKHTTTHPVTNHTTTPPVTNHTTTPPVTNHTTTPPVTNHTTTPPVTTHTATPPVTNHSTPHYSTTAHTNYTTVHPSTVPTTPDFFANGTSGPCLRMTAVLEITVNGTKQIQVPPPPVTQSDGKCYKDRVELALGFPGATLSLAFAQDSTNFYLEEVNVTLLDKESSGMFGATVREMEAPLGQSFSCDLVTLKVTSSLVVTASKVQAQAFQLNGSDYGPAKSCYKANMTVPIVVGIILLVLILVVVLAYFIGRRRRTGGYEML